MSDPSKASPADGETEPILSPEQLAEICAAMMEELGNARKDTLPLAGPRGETACNQVDLQALDRTKKSNDRRTLEFQITQRNAEAHNAWKTAVYDVHPADRELDDLDSGQAHRQGLVARLAAQNSSSRGRGNFSNGGRGDMSIRGGHSASRRGGSVAPRLVAGPNDARAYGLVDWSIRGQPASRGLRGLRGRATIMGSGSTRGGIHDSPQTAGATLTPRPNLSFHDNRSINVLPMPRNPVSNPSSSSRTSSPARALPKSSSFRLATPEEFLQQSWLPKLNRPHASMENPPKLPVETTVFRPLEGYDTVESPLLPRHQESSLITADTTNTSPLIQISETASSGVPPTIPSTKAGLSYAEDLEDLICFSENKNDSSWLQDLLCLIDDKTCEEAPQAVGKEITPFPSIEQNFRGLATSIYAATEIVDKFLVENPPLLGNPAADRIFGEEVKRRAAVSSFFSNTAEKMDQVDHLICFEAEGSIEQQGLVEEKSHQSEQCLVPTQNSIQEQLCSQDSPRVQYSIETLMGFRANASPLPKPLMGEWIEDPRRGRLRSVKSDNGGNVDTKPEVKNTDCKVSKAAKVRGSTSSLQNIEEVFDPTDGDKSPASNEKDIFSVESLKAAQSMDQDAFRNAETLSQECHHLALNLEKLRKRDSIASLTSKDSDSTVKPLVDADCGKPPQPRETTFHGHSSHSSLDTTTSTASFATASEETAYQLDDPTNQISAGLQGLNLNLLVTGTETALNAPFEFPPVQKVELDRAASTVSIETPRSEDVFDQIRKSTGVSPTSAPFVPKSFGDLPRATNPTTTSLLKAKGGLSSSRYASTGFFTPPVLSNIENRSRKRPVNPEFPVVGQAALKSYAPYARNAPAGGFGPPSINNAFPALPVAPPVAPPVRVNPMVATVVIDDPMNPGSFVEVTGHLKAGGSHFVAHMPTFNNLGPACPGVVNQNHQPRYVANGPISPPVSRARTLVTPTRDGNDETITAVQQEVQLRLQKSLASPRSPNGT